MSEIIMSEPKENIPVSKLLNTATFECQTLDEAHAIADFIADACPNSQLATVSILEILINSIEHGNLDISSYKKENLQRNEQWLQEIDRRLKLDQYNSKYVIIELTKSDDEITLVVTDEGNGFDWEKYESLDMTKISGTNGRGIIMAKSLTFKKLIYNDIGNQVICIISLKD